MKTLLFSLFVFLLNVTLQSGQAQTPTPEAESLLKRALAISPDAQRGEAEFAQQECLRCHRKDASGRSAGHTPRLSGQHASVIIKQVLDIRSGLRHNPSMQAVVTEEKLSLQTLADIAAHLQALPMSGKMIMGPGTGVARGKELFAKDCVSCHGPSGEGNSTTFVPMVAAQHYPYLLRELEFIRDGQRGNSNPAMVSLIKTYAQDDLQAVADYLAQLPAPKRQ